MKLKEQPSALSIIFMLRVLPNTCKSTSVLLLHRSERERAGANGRLERQSTFSETDDRTGTNCEMLPVAEPIALSLCRATGDIYLDTQIFTECMFIGASVCRLFLRSRKIGQDEEEAAAAAAVERGQDDGNRHPRRRLREEKHPVSSRKNISQRLFQVAAV